MMEEAATKPSNPENHPTLAPCVTQETLRKKETVCAYHAHGFESLVKQGIGRMTATRRPVKLSLNEDLVTEARSMTENLAAVMESLLTDFVMQERAKRAAQDEALKQAIASWNAFSERYDSFADEHSTLGMAQFDVYRNGRRNRTAIRYVVTVRLRSLMITGDAASVHW
jgi:antitoxin CcdA